MDELLVVTWGATSGVRMDSVPGGLSSGLFFAFAHSGAKVAAHEVKCQRADAGWLVEVRLFSGRVVPAPAWR